VLQPAWNSIGGAAPFGLAAKKCDCAEVDKDGAMEGPEGLTVMVKTMKVRPARGPDYQKVKG
jgi:hypothetical protein